MPVSTRFARILLGWLIYLSLASVPRALANTYTTNFASTENPISQGGIWVNGGAVGLDWSNVQTTGGVKAWGTQVPSGAGTNDSIAALTGTWGTNQTAYGTSATQPGATNEIEILLHATITAHSARLYEFNCSLGYQEIVKWLGALNSYTILAQNNSVGCPSGAVLKATAVTNSNGSVTLTAYIDGTQVNQVTDSNTPYAGGSPGIGFWIGSGGNNNNAGISSYTATDGSTTQTSGTSSPPGQNNYSTNFSLTENPISEGGIWINGGVTGIDWGNVQTVPGQAFGVSMSSTYGDPTAVLAGTWGPDQQAQATIKINTSQSNCCHEVELRLRTTITPHSITGYEINCSISSSTPYIQIVRWNGALSNFTYVNASGNGAVGCANGDVLKATIAGSTITVYKNGTQILQGTDSTFTSGSPGIGFYDNADTNWSYFGFSNFSASDSSSTTQGPQPPTGLKATVN